MSNNEVKNSEGAILGLLSGQVTHGELTKALGGNPFRRRFVRRSLSVEAGWQGRRLPGSSLDRCCLRRGT
jgi:hypothetical protein